MAEAARARGRKGGRKPVIDDRKIALASKLMRDRETPVSEVCEAVGVSRATLYQYLSPEGCRKSGASLRNPPPGALKPSGAARSLQASPGNPIYDLATWTVSSPMP